MFGRSWVRLAALATACGLAVVLISFGVDGTAGATASRTPLKTVEVTQPASPPSAPTNAPQGAPAGCNSGYFCAYKTGNGGNLCFQTTGNLNWPSGCATHIDSVYDNNGTKGVYIYWGFTYYGAFYFLCAKCYLLNMTTNRFNQCPTGGTSCPGYGQVMADNAASSKFQ